MRSPEAYRKPANKSVVPENSSAGSLRIFKRLAKRPNDSAGSYPSSPPGAPSGASRSCRRTHPGERSQAGPPRRFSATHPHAEGHPLGVEPHPSAAQRPVVHPVAAWTASPVLLEPSPSLALGGLARREVRARPLRKQFIASGRSMQQFPDPGHRTSLERYVPSRHGLPGHAPRSVTQGPR